MAVPVPIIIIIVFLLQAYFKFPKIVKKHLKIANKNPHPGELYKVKTTDLYFESEYITAFNIAKKNLK